MNSPSILSDNQLTEKKSHQKFYQGDYWLQPNLKDERLCRITDAWDENGNKTTIPIIAERALTIFLNSQEVVTAMTIGDYPEYLALGFLRNQAMLSDLSQVTKVEYDEELSVVVVRTKNPTEFEIKSKKKIVTSGCGQGTIFGDVMDKIQQVGFLEQPKLPILKTSDLRLLLKRIALTPCLYLKTGAIHGSVLAIGTEPKIYMEDVGRHNAVDKISGYMFQHQIDGNDKIFYTTGRLTSEMVIKCVMMGIPILVSRNGFTAFGVELAKQANVTLIGRARGERFSVVSAVERLEFND